MPRNLAKTVFFVLNNNESHKTCLKKRMLILIQFLGRLQYTDRVLCSTFAAENKRARNSRVKRNRL